MKEKQVINVDFSKGIHRSLDRYLLGSNGLLYATNNLLYNDGVLQRSPGFSPYIAGVLSGAPIAFGNYKWTNGSQNSFCISTTRLHLRNGAAWDQKGVGDWTASEENRTSHCYYYTSGPTNYLILTNKSLPVKKYTGALADLGGLTATYAYTCAAFMSHLLIANTTESAVESPWRIRWSSVGTCETWAGGTAGLLDLIDTDDAILKLKPMLNKLFAYREKSMWEIIYVGGTQIFRALPLIQNIGTKAPDTISDVYGVTGREGFNIFLGNDNVYLFDGRGISAVGDPIAKSLYGPKTIVDLNSIERCQGIFDRGTKMYHLAVPTSGANQYPETFFSYDMITGTWWGPSVPGIPLRCFGIDQAIGQTWNSTNPLVGTWAAQTGSWDSYGIPSDVIIVGSAAADTVMKLDTTTYLVNGTVPVASIETGDYSPGKTTRWLRFDAEVYGASGATLYYSTDEGASWILVSTKAGVAGTFKEVHWTNMNFSSDQCRFKLILGSDTTKVRRISIVCQRRML